MTKEPSPGGLRRSALALFIPIFFMVGCGSTSQPERTIPVVNMTEPLPEAKVESKPPETTSVGEQNAVTKVDEKNSVFFSLGSSTVSQSERGKVHLATQRLKADRNLHVTLIGHANDNGSRSFNLAVADSRVESVSRILKKLGVNTHQIKKQVMGGENTPGTCLSVNCRQKMRRVELIISTAE